MSNVKRETQPVMLPNGKDYCMELATSEDAQDECGGDLEDALYAAHRKLRSVYDMAVSFTDRLRLQRNPCSRWEKITRRDRCKPKNSTTGD